MRETQERGTGMCLGPEDMSVAEIEKAIERSREWAASARENGWDSYAQTWEGRVENFTRLLEERRAEAA